MTLHADADQRAAIYRKLQARNRIVSLLRLAVPALGVVALVILVGQIYVASLGSRFGVNQIAFTQDMVTVVAPEYAGLLDDGTGYHVSAISAEAQADATERIALIEAALTMTKLDGVIMTVQAPRAVLDTIRQQVEIADVAYVANSLGTRGTIYDSVFDFATQTLVGNGPVIIDYDDGTHLEAEGIEYDAVSLVWTFKRAAVTLPDTPGPKDKS